MRIKCKYSGLEFISSGFNHLHLMGEHPLMYASVDTLLSRARDWSPVNSRRDLSEPERRLLFIALLKATDAVIFSTPAIPSKQTIERNMAGLLQVVGWKTKLGDRIKLPGYHITRDTYQLKNINQWINRWNEEKRRWEAGGLGPSEWDFRKKLRVREEALERLLIGSSAELSRYQKRLAVYVMDAMGAPKYTREDWIEIFNLREDKEIFKTPLVNIEELLEFMEDHLDAYNILAKIAFQHVRVLRQKKVGGFELAVGASEEETGEEREGEIRSSLTLEQWNRLQSNPYLIIDNTSTNKEAAEEEQKHAAERLEIDPLEAKYRSETGKEILFAVHRRETRILQFSNLPEPKEASYSTRIEYLKAMAAYRVAKRAVEEQQQLLLEAKKKQKELDKATKEEDTDFSSFAEEVEEEENSIRLEIESKREGEKNYD